MGDDTGLGAVGHEELGGVEPGQGHGAVRMIPPLGAMWFLCS